MVELEESALSEVNDENEISNVQSLNVSRLTSWSSATDSELSSCSNPFTIAIANSRSVLAKIEYRVDVRQTSAHGVFVSETEGKALRDNIADLEASEDR